MENRITLQECCVHYQVEEQFVQQLGERGLLRIYTYERQAYLLHDDLVDLEKYMHLHYDLDINMAGMEAIKHLLERVHTLQQELRKHRTTS